MARQPIQADYTSFIKGMITEASPITFPENATLEDVNYILSQDGSRHRRLGMDLEEGGGWLNTGVGADNANLAICSHIWSSVSNTGDFNIVVVQMGLNLYFFNASTFPISTALLNQGQPVTLNGDETIRISGSSIYGKFVVTNGRQEVAILSYDSESDIVLMENRRLLVRDLWGVHEDIPVDHRPYTLTDPHNYNIQNQGWVDVIDCSLGPDGSGGGDMRNPIEYTKFRLGIYPSNVDILWASKLSSAVEVDAIGTYSPWQLEKQNFGTTPAPKGKYIVDVFNRGQARREQSGIESLPLDISYGGVIAVETYAGRVFYALKETGRHETDTNSPVIGNMIVFSSAGEKTSLFTTCHSEADPTSEHIYDVVATDGGFISIPDAGEIKSLVAMGQSLFVFCSNGVWEIHGGEEAFSATNQNVNKVTDLGAISDTSILYVEDNILYWSKSGIYKISRNDLTLRGSNNDLTFSTIQKFYDAIPLEERMNAVGIYDKFSRTCRWMYGDVSRPAKWLFHKELVYDLTLGAWYTTELPSSIEYGVYIAGAVPISVPIILENGDRTGIEYFVIQASMYGSAFIRVSFGYYKDMEFRDWRSVDGIGRDAPAHLLTGFITGGSPMTEKELSYIHVYSKKTETGFYEDGEPINPSSTTVQVQWDWTTTSKQGRWSRPFEAYRLPRMYLPFDSGDNFDFGYSTITTKNKLRGRGKALSVLFFTKPGHDSHLYGWSIVGSANVK